MAFRAFQISDEFQEKYGYPKITPEIRAKVFGLNSAEAYGLSPETCASTPKLIQSKKQKRNRRRRDPSYLSMVRRTAVNFCGSWRNRTGDRPLAHHS